MRCAYHPDREPIGACVECGRLICVECKATLGGRMYCTPCADRKFVAKGTEPAVTPPAPPPASPAVDRAPPTGNPEAVTVSTTAFAERPIEKPLKKKHRGRGWLIALAVVVVIFGGGFLWLRWPDLPPNPMMALTNKVSSVFSKETPLPPLDPATQKLVDAAVAKQVPPTPAPKPGSIEEKEAQIQSQLKATGLPITGAFILESEKGQPVLAVGLSYERIAGSVSPSAGLSEGLSGLQRIIDTKTLSLAGLHDVTVFIEDAEGRVLFGMSAPVTAIEQYRAGKITQRDLIGSVGFQAESRMGVLDALRKVVTP